MIQISDNGIMKEVVFREDLDNYIMTNMHVYMEMYLGDYLQQKDIDLSEVLLKIQKEQKPEKFI